MLCSEWLGWLLVIAAAVLALIGRNRFMRLMTWAEKFAVRLPHLGRIGGVFAALFGVFLVYAYL